MSDIVISGGSILTLDGENSFHEQGSVEITDGIIESIHSGTHSRGNVLDANGKVVIPGLINGHTHTFIHMFRGLDDDKPLFPWLETLSPAIGLLNEEDMRQSNYLGVMEAILTGTTTLCECCRYNPIITAEIGSELGLRVFTGGMPASEWFGEKLDTDLDGLKNKTQYISEHPEEYNGLAYPYLGVHSPYNCSPSFIRRAKENANELDVHFNIHLSETQDEIDLIERRYGKSPVEFLEDLGVLDDKLIADHCVFFDADDISLFSESGAGIIHNPISNAKLWSGVAPIKEYLDAGIPVGLGTDSVVSNNSFNMFEEMKFGTLLQRAGSHSSSKDPVNAYDFLKMATIGSAKVLGLDKEIGSLEEGKRADIVVVDLPPEMPLSPHHVISHLVYSTEPKHIDVVIVDGKVVARDGALENTDSEELRSRLKEYFSSRWKEIREKLPDEIFIT